MFPDSVNSRWNKHRIFVIVRRRYVSAPVFLRANSKINPESVAKISALGSLPLDIYNSFGNSLRALSGDLYPAPMFFLDTRRDVFPEFPDDLLCLLICRLLSPE
jgi:hypothetical protein